MQGAAQFYLTFEGHPQERPCQLALEELELLCKKVTVLGVYSRRSGTLPEVAAYPISRRLLGSSVILRLSSSSLISDG